MMPGHICEIDGCERPAPRSTLCDMHRQRVSRHGHPCEPAPRRQYLTDAQIRKALELLAAGTPPRETATAVGCNPCTIRRLAQRTGVRVVDVPNGRTRLTADDVRSIRTRAGAGESHASIARSFDCGAAAVSSIVRRRNWKHVE